MSSYVQFLEQKQAKEAYEFRKDVVEGLNDEELATLRRFLEFSDPMGPRWAPNLANEVYNYNKDMIDLVYSRWQRFENS